MNLGMLHAYFAILSLSQWAVKCQLLLILKHQCKAVVIPLLTHWSYCSLLLSYRCVSQQFTSALTLCLVTCSVTVSRSCPTGPQVSFCCSMLVSHSASWSSCSCCRRINSRWRLDKKTNNIRLMETIPVKVTLDISRSPIEIQWGSRKYPG